MRLRYKKSMAETWSSTFNTHGLGEVLTGDDSAIISEMDIFVNGEWKDMRQAFQDKDIVPDNYNQYFGPPLNEECKRRGYNP